MKKEELKQEFLNFWVKNPNELMPNPENRHKAVVTGELFMKQLDEIISEAIAEHEAKHDDSIDYFIDKVNYMRGLYQNGKFTRAEEIKTELMQELENVKMLPFKK